LGIKIVNKGGKIKVKGNPLGSNIAYFFAVLFFIAGFINLFSHILGAIILTGIGIIIVAAGAHHSHKAKIKKLEAGYNALAGGSKIIENTGQSGYHSGYHISNFFWGLDAIVWGFIGFVAFLGSIIWLITFAH
jgi:hypothetical protein